MGAKVTFDGINKIIQVTLAPVGGEVAIDVQADLYSDMKEDWITDSTLNKLRPPISVIGGQATTGGDSAGDIYFLDPAWKIRPYEAGHRLILNGSFFSTDGTSVFTFTIGTFQILTEIIVSSLVTKVSTGSGVTQQDKDDITAGVWTEAVRTLTSVVSGGLTTEQAYQLQELYRIKGLDILYPLSITPTSMEADDVTLVISGDGITNTTVTRTPTIGFVVDESDNYLTDEFGNNIVG